jgi:hypothetical protein
MIVGRMFPDDWAMVVTMVFAYAFLLELLMTIKTYHAGLSGARLTPPDMTGILKVGRTRPVRKMLLTDVCVAHGCNNCHLQGVAYFYPGVYSELLPPPW